MKLITHHDKLVNQEFSLTTIVIKSVDEKTRHALCLKKRAMALRAGGHEVGV